MASLAELLTRAISSVPRPSEAQGEILDRLSALRSRFDEGLLRVAVLGQFKRGKSTLLNALLGARVLPTGVTPVTALPTFISAGDSTRLRIAFRDGKEPSARGRCVRNPRVLERYVSESQNPHNRLGVESVAVEVRSDFLDEGIVLIDTPGVGSTFLHNTRAAEAVLSECDAALFVLSADPPITEAEANYLDKVRKLIPRVVFVLNKVDLLDATEKGVAERFLADVLAERRPTEPPDRIFALSAKQGLQAKLTNDAGALEASGLPRSGTSARRRTRARQARDPSRHGAVALDFSGRRIAFSKRTRTQGSSDARGGAEAKGRHIRDQRRQIRGRAAAAVRSAVDRLQATCCGSSTRKRIAYGTKREANCVRSSRISPMGPSRGNRRANE